MLTGKYSSGFVRSFRSGSAGLVVAFAVLGSAAADAQPVGPNPPASAVAYSPITGSERVEWIVEGTVGPRSLGVGVLASAWQTAWNTPDEWGQSWSGAGRRYAAREADVAISSTMEAGLGAIWGEEPRYIRAP